MNFFQIGNALPKSDWSSFAGNGFQFLFEYKEVTWEFKEAVLIAMLTAKFGNEKFPLGRKRYTKLSYLFHRYVDNQAKNYLRKAARASTRQPGTTALFDSFVRYP